MLFFILLIWFVLCIAVGVGAANRNRFGFGWFLFAFFLSPLVAGFALLLLGAKPPRRAIGTVEACSPFSPKTAPVPKLKHGDWSNVAWTPEQQAKQKLIQADKAKIAEIYEKEQYQLKLGLAFSTVIVVVGLLILNFA